MFFKPFKKAIALFVALVFVLSLMPTVGMAEEKTDSLPLSNYTYARSQYATTNYYDDTYGDIQARKGNIVAYAQINLSGYEEILLNDGTAVSLTLQTGGSTKNRYFYDMTVKIVDDSCDDYNAQTLNWNDAEQLGLNKDNGTVIFSYNSGTNDTDELTSIQTKTQTQNVDISLLNNALQSGSDDSIVTLVLTSDNSTASYSCLKKASLNITYNSADIDDADYAKDIAEGIDWSDISSEPMTAVTKNLNLPTKLYGTDVVWTSTNEGAVNSAGEVTQTNVEQSTVLTATVRYKGETESISFNVTVDNITYTYTNIDDGTEALSRNGGSISTTANETVYASLVNGKYGKTPDDASYELHDAAETTNFVNYFKTNTDTTGTDDIVEFSICVPYSSPKTRVSSQLYNATGERGNTKDFYIGSDGIYENSVKVYSLKPNTWYTLAFVAPKGIRDNAAGESDDTNAEIYVNGVLAHTIDWGHATKNGIRTFQFYGTAPDMATVNCYLDNLRVYSGEYNPDYDALPNLSSEFISNLQDTITIKEATVASLKAIISSDDDTSLRIYDTEGNLVSDENASVLDGYTLVAAAKNGTNMERSYAYLKIRVTGSNCSFDIPHITIENNIAKAEVKLYNNSDEKAEYTAYLAIYSGNELLKVESAPVCAQSGEIGVAPIQASISAGNTAKLMVWKNMIPQFVAVQK